MAPSPVTRRRRALVITSAAAVLALPAAGHAAPKAPYPPPNHPAPVEQSAAGHARTPSDRHAAQALAQERYYASYGTPAAAPVRASVPAPPATGGGGGIDTAPFVLAVAGALLVGLGAGRRSHDLAARLHPGSSHHPGAAG